MKRLDESSVLWLKKWGGTLTESDDYYSEDYFSEIISLPLMGLNGKLRSNYQLDDHRLKFALRHGNFDMGVDAAIQNVEEMLDHLKKLKKIGNL